MDDKRSLIFDEPLNRKRTEVSDGFSDKEKELMAVAIESLKGKKQSVNLPKSDRPMPSPMPPQGEMHVPKSVKIDGESFQVSMNRTDQVDASGRMNETVPKDDAYLGEKAKDHAIAEPDHNKEEAPIDECEGVGVALGNKEESASDTEPQNPDIVPDESFGGCYYFDGTARDDYYHRLSAANDVITLCTWVYPTKLKTTVLGIGCLAASTPAFINLCFEEEGIVLNSNEGQGGTISSEESGFVLNKWHYISLVLDMKKGLVDFYLNGEELESMTADLGKNFRDAAKDTFKNGDTISIELQLGGWKQTFFVGRIANFRLFTGRLSQEALKEDLSSDRSALSVFKSENPIEFRLVNDEGRSELYIDDSGNVHKINLEILNTSNEDIMVGQVDEKDPPVFRVSFRSGVFDRDSLSCGCGSCETDASTNLTLLSLQVNSDTVIKAGDCLPIPLEYTSASRVGGARITNVMLEYRNLSYISRKLIPEGRRVYSVSVTSQQGKKGIPLYCGFIGHGSVLTNAQENEPLSIGIVNTQPQKDIKLKTGGEGAEGAEASRISVSFLVGDHDMAAFSPVESKDIACSVRLVSPSGEEDQEASWTYLDTKGDKVLKESVGMYPFNFINESLEALKPGWVLVLTFDKIKTMSKAGTTPLVVSYKNIPGYWDEEQGLELSKVDWRFRKSDYDWLVQENKNLAKKIDDLCACWEENGPRSLVDKKVKLRSWKGDYLHRPDSYQGVTTWKTGIGNEWTIVDID